MRSNLSKRITMTGIFLVKLIFILSTITSLAQYTKKEYTMEQLKSKQKRELIEIALEILKKKESSVIINSDEFESTAWENSTEIIVKFRRHIRFISLKADPLQYYDITVNLITKEILPFDSGYNFTFYVPNQEEKKHLNFINSKIDLPKHLNSEITITENEEYYWISINSKTSFSKYFINKKTDFKSGEIQNTFAVFQPKPVLESLYEKEELINFFDENDVGQKTKKEITNMAILLLKEKHPLLSLDFNDYEITVLGDSKNTLVEFKRIIRYFPLGTNPNKRFSYDIQVNLNTKEVAPFDDYFQSEFYIETKKDKKAIEFIKKNFGGFSSNFENTIYEGEEDYFIDIKNQYSFGKYTINKKTGIKKTEIQASYDLIAKPYINQDLDNLIEIK